MTVTSTPPGIPSPARLENWLRTALPAEPGGPGEAGGPSDIRLADVQLIAGGRSNLTYRLTISVPANTVPANAPGGAGPANAPGGAGPANAPGGAGAGAIGAPFYLMDYVPGVVLRSRQDTAALTEPQNADLSERLADMLAAIHGVDIEATGLRTLGRGAGYLTRQLGRWQRQWELSKTREVPGYDQLVARLTATLPPEGETTLVHGDFRLDNVLVTLSPRPRISAVVDWEMATLGDPLADLGLTLVYWTDPGEEGWLDPDSGPAGPGLRTDGTTSPGFLTRAEFAAGYARRTGRDISRIGYYVAFGYFKLAVVLEGIHARYLQHQTVGEGFEQEGLVVPTLVARAHAVLDADD